MQTNTWGPPAQPQRTNPLAKAALICGLLEFLVFPGAIAAIILGHKARHVIRRTGENGRGLATAGLTLGYVGLAFVLVATYPLLFAHLAHVL